MRYATHLGYLPPTRRPQFLETLGTDEPTAHVRFAAKEGMAGVLYSWAVEKSPTERETVRRALDETGLACSCIAALPFELMVSPIWTDRSKRSRAALEAALVTASNVAVSLTSTVLAVIVIADPDRVDDSRQREDLVANLQDMAPVAHDHGLTIAVEPMLRPGSLLRTTATAVDVIVGTGRPNVGLIYDTTHVSMMDGDLLPVLTQHFEHIVSLQLSDEPGRIEPGAGTLPLVEVAVEAARRGYTGLVDLEHGWRDPTKEGERAGLARVHTFASHVLEALASP